MTRVRNGAANAARTARSSGRAWRGAMLAAGAVLFLAGCNTIPDSLNPFSKAKPAEKTVLDTSKVPGQDKQFPALSSVPKKPAPVLSAAQRKDVVEGLIADRDNARHTDGTGQGGAAKDGEAPKIQAQPRAPVKELSTSAAPAANAVKITTVAFPAGSATLPAQAKTILAQVAVALKSRGGKLRILGHASGKTGSAGGEMGPAQKLRLSADRAKAVADELMRNGVRRSDIAESALADTRPPAKDAPDRRLGDDRAEIYYIGS